MNKVYRACLILLLLLLLFLLYVIPLAIFWLKFKIFVKLAVVFHKGNFPLLFHSKGSSEIMEGKKTSCLKSPFTKRPFAVGYHELHEISDWKYRVSETKKNYRWLNVSSDLKWYEETMTNKEREKEGYVNRWNRVHKWEKRIP